MAFLVWLAAASVLGLLVYTGLWGPLMALVIVVGIPLTIYEALTKPPEQL